MTAYESMVNKLLPLSIYNIATDSLIEAELRAYAEVLQELYDDVDDALKECFVQTAEGEGLTSLELMTRAYESGDTLEERREKIITRLSIKPTDIGVEGLKKAVKSLGLDCNIREVPPNSWLYIDILTNVDESKRSFVEAEVKKFAPRHLVLHVTFSDE